jgi:branched-chain amino acid transport system substrate-binding protein
VAGGSLAEPASASSRWPRTENQTEMKNSRRFLATAAAAIGVACGSLAATGEAKAAPPDVVIGAIYPLSGNAAPVGHDAEMALQTEAEIINGSYNIPMLLAKTSGLPNLGGAKIKLVFADSQNNPQIARTEAERLITQDHVVAIIGSYTSSTAVTISQICNRYQIPYLSAENSSPSLRQQGLTWFFRPSPTDIDFTAEMFKFFAGIGKKTGKPVHSIAIIHENSVFGTDSSRLQAADAKKAGIKVLANISYQASTPSLSVEAERLRAANADVVMPSSYTNDAILMVRSMHDIGYKPKAIVAQDAGFIDPDFIKAIGPLAEGIMSRSSYAPDAIKARPAIPAVNAMIKAHDDGKDLNDLTSREVTGLEVLADAINRAGSTKNTALQAALRATNIPGDQTIMPWVGVKFDQTGQNTEGNPVIIQYQHGAWKTIFPFEVATAPAEWDVGK